MERIIIEFVNFIMVELFGDQCNELYWMFPLNWQALNHNYQNLLIPKIIIHLNQNHRCILEAF